MNTPTQQERKQMASRYSQPKKIKHWEVVSCGVVVFESTSPAIASWWVKNSGIKAVKRAVYEQR